MPGRRTLDESVASGEVSREKLDEKVSKCIGLLYVRSVPAVGDDLLTVAAATCSVLVEHGADLGDHRLGWVDLFPWPVRHHPDLSEVAEVRSRGVRDR